MSANDIWNANTLFGTCVMYAADPKRHTAFCGDFELTTLQESAPEQTRGYRKSRRRKSKRVLQLPDHALHDDLVVLVGPLLSAPKVVQTLRRLAAQIEKKGMMTGRLKDGEFTFEPGKASNP